VAAEPAAGQQHGKSNVNAAAAAAAAAALVSDASAAAWDAGSVVSSCSSCGSNGRQQELQMQPPLDRSHGLGKAYGSGPLIHSSSPLPLPGSGDLLLPVTAAPAGSDVWELSESHSKGHGASASQSSSSSSRAALKACWMGIGGAAGSGVPLGLQLAGAITTSPDGISHLVLPMILQGSGRRCACFGGYAQRALMLWSCEPELCLHGCLWLLLSVALMLCCLLLSESACICFPTRHLLV